MCVLYVRFGLFLLNDRIIIFLDIGPAVAVSPQ